VLASLGENNRRQDRQVLRWLGEAYDGIIHCDRRKPCEVIGKALHQFCHSHIWRDIQAMLESWSETGTQGCVLKLASDRAFHLWHQWERSELS